MLSHPLSANLNLVILSFWEARENQIPSVAHKSWIQAAAEPCARVESPGISGAPLSRGDGGWCEAESCRTPLCHDLRLFFLSLVIPTCGLLIFAAWHARLATGLCGFASAIRSTLVGNPPRIAGASSSHGPGQNSGVGLVHGPGGWHRAVPMDQRTANLHVGASGKKAASRNFHDKTSPGGTIGHAKNETCRR